MCLHTSFHPAGLGKSMGHETHTKNHEKTTWLGTSTHEAELNMVRCRVRRDKAYGSEQQRGKAGKFSVCPYGVVSRGRSRRWHCHTQTGERLDLSSTALLARHSLSFARSVGRATNARRSRFVTKSHDTPYLTAKLRLIRFVAAHQTEGHFRLLQGKERGLTTNLVGRSSACGGAARG